jgi:hypothetical protein
MLDTRVGAFRQDDVGQIPGYGFALAGRDEQGETVPAHHSSKLYPVLFSSALFTVMMLPSGFTARQ